MNENGSAYHRTRKRIRPSSSWETPMIRFAVYLRSKPSLSFKNIFVIDSSPEITNLKVLWPLVSSYFLFRMSLFEFGDHRIALKILWWFPCLLVLWIPLPFYQILRSPSKLIGLEILKRSYLALLTAYLEFLQLRKTQSHHPDPGKITLSVRMVFEDREGNYC